MNRRFDMALEKANNINRPATKDISIVIPVYNEEESLLPLCEEINNAMHDHPLSYEIIFIDDGSKDNSPQILRDVQKKMEHVSVIRFARNYGQTAAMSAGFDFAEGKIIVTLDADLQNDPADIRILIDEMNRGYDIVSGWRYERKDAWLSRKLPSKCANWLISKLSGVHLHDYGCTLKAYSSDIIKNLHLYGDMHRFIPAAASFLGASVSEVRVNHRPRQFGSSKYGISRTVKVILDLMTMKFLISYSTKPIQVFGLPGIASFIMGFLAGIYLVWIKLVLGNPISGRPLLMLSVLLILIGIQFVALGLLGELMIRIYHEGQGKQTYTVKEVITSSGPVQQFPNNGNAA